MMNSSGRSSPGMLRRVFYNSSELRAGWRLAIFFAMVYALIQGYSLTFGKLLSSADSSVQFLVFGLSDFLTLLIATWIMGRLENRTIGDYGLPWRSMFRGQFWQGALLGFTTLTVLLVFMRLAGVFYFGHIVLHGADMLKWGVAFAFAFLLVALREEFRSRGYGLFTLAGGIWFWPAAIVSSAFFGYGHHGNSGEDWIGLLNAGLYGLLACFWLRGTGNLWFPIGFHMAFDWGETYFYGVPDSGLVHPGHLFEPGRAGVAWLSGGTVGPEGSVLCTVMLIVVWLLCALWLRDVKFPGSAAAPRKSLLSR